MSAVLLTHLFRLGISLFIRNLAHLQLPKHIVCLLLKQDSLHIRRLALRVVLQCQTAFDEQRHMGAYPRCIESLLLSIHHLAQFLPG